MCFVISDIVIVCDIWSILTVDDIFSVILKLYFQKDAIGNVDLFVISIQRCFIRYHLAKKWTYFCLC